VLWFALLGAFALAASYVYLAPDLPSSESMRKVELQIPLRVYTRNGALMAQIGEQRRIPVTYIEIPLIVKQAFLAAEDERFFTHHGIDFPGVMRAVYVDLVAGDRAQGASTITMQAARNMYLTQDRTWRRKLEETFLTYRMEHEFTKEEIFGLYLNVIFFGQRAYGVAAAAETFFGKSLNQLTVAQAATLGGIPKAPSHYNPIVNPQAAAGRRSYVLRRMLDLGFINAATAQSANQEPMLARTHAPLYDIEAPDVAEMARQEVRARFGAGAENAGYRVYTTIDGRLQTAATGRCASGSSSTTAATAGAERWRTRICGDEKPPRAVRGLLEPIPTVGICSRRSWCRWRPGGCASIVKSRGFAQIEWDGLCGRAASCVPTCWPAPKKAGTSRAGRRRLRGHRRQGSAQLAQPPAAQSALVALDPTDGAVAALVGGFDFFDEQIQPRDPGAPPARLRVQAVPVLGALENGFTPRLVLWMPPS
jgi:penicillin-binding protein 1A